MNKKTIKPIFIVAVFILGIIGSYYLGAINILGIHNPVRAEGKLEGTRTAEFGFRPNQGLVPDEETAVKIAEAAWLPIYGDAIYDKLPFKARYDDIAEVWYVRGTVPRTLNGGLQFGGTPEMTIRKEDGQILFVIHSK